MRHIFRLLGFLLSLAVIVSAAVLWWGIETFNRKGPLENKTEIVIEPGETLGAIARKLQTHGAITRPQVFKTAVRISGAQSSLKAGEYALEAGISQKQIMELLLSGKVIQRRITIPEGLTSHQIVGLLKEDERLTGDIASIPEEGTLLPETYSFSRRESRSDIIRRMQSAMEKTLSELWESRAADLPVSSPLEALILASIVEKETGVPGERARIAGVFINRLNRGIPLQSDPTVIYAHTRGMHQNEGLGPMGRRLLTKDLELDSPYNTYRNPGLPPGPIANPGREAIAAVLNPEQHSFIYFVADGTGGHAFAQTLEEHNRNVANWRKIRQSNPSPD